MSQATNPTLTVSEVMALLNDLGLRVPDREGFAAIRAAEGTKFSTALANLREPGSATESQRDYVESVVCAAAPQTREMFAQQGYSADVVRLIEIAKSEGRSFRNAVSLVADGTNKRESKVAMDYLVGLLDEYGAAMPFDMGDMHFPANDDQRERVQEREQVVTRGSPEQHTPAAPQQGATVAPTTATRTFGASVHVYGLKAALCVSETTMPNSTKATISFEVAQRTSEGKTLWQDKIALMLSAHEHPLCLGVFLGYLQKMEIKGHGRQQEKAMTIANQGNQFFLTMIVRGQSPRAVPIPAEYAYPLVAMLIGQMQKNDSHLTQDLILQVTKSICDMRVAERRVQGDHHG